MRVGDVPSNATCKCPHCNETFHYSLNVQAVSRPAEEVDKSMSLIDKLGEGLRIPLVDVDTAIEKKTVEFNEDYQRRLSFSFTKNLNEDANITKVDGSGADKLAETLFKSGMPYSKIQKVLGKLYENQD